MTISLLVAVSQNGVIGQGNKLPWHIPSELKHFAKETAHKTMLVGRTTWESMAHIDLKDRTVYVITSDPAGCLQNPKLVTPKNKGKVVFTSNPELVIEKHKVSRQRLVIVGGKSIYERCAKYCDRFVVTTILRDYEGDVTLDPFKGIPDVMSNKHFDRKVAQDVEAGTPAYEVNYYTRDMPNYPEPTFLTPEQYKELVDSTDGYEYTLDDGSVKASEIMDKSVVVMDPVHDLAYQTRTVRVVQDNCKSVKEQFRAIVAKRILEHVLVRPSFHKRTPSAFVMAHVETLARRLPRTAFDTIDVPVTEADRHTAYLVFPRPIKTFSEGKLNEVASRMWNTKKLIILGLNESPDYERLKELITKGLRKHARQKGIEIQFKG